MQFDNCPKKTQQGETEMNEKCLWSVIAFQFFVIMAMAIHFMDVPWYWWTISAMGVIIVLLYLAAAHFSRAELATHDVVVTNIKP